MTLNTETLASSDGAEAVIPDPGSFCIPGSANPLLLGVPPPRRSDVQRL